MMKEINMINTARNREELFKKFKSKLNEDKFLTRQLVSFQANKTIPIFRWFKYKEGFSANFVSYYIEKFNLQGKKVLDPFAWIGTTLFAASEYGCEATGIELFKGLYWVKSKKKRLLLMNVNVPIVSKNVDLCLFDGKPKEIILKGKTQNSIHRLPKRYIGLGELKGGIDPAGADEHWKTANSALNRIRVRFTKNKVSPTTFFVGAAIENNMAKEIFKQLEKGTLTNAGNLTENEQVTSVCDWLIKL
jgi:hypothetical protein